MEVGIQVTIKGPISWRGKPFHEGLPLPQNEIIDLLATEGFEAREVGLGVILNAKYDPEWLVALKQVFHSRDLNVNFDTSLYAKYDDADFAASPLWIALTNSEVFIEHLRTRSNCAECGKGRAAVDTSARVPHVPRKSGFVSVNGEFHIARSDLKRAMEQELTGTRFLPFDDAGQYFYVLAEKELGPLVIEPRQPGFIGFCSVCGRPQFRPSWEPDGYIPTIQCYRANTWSGQDLAWSDRYEMAFFSPRAFRLLKKFQKGIKRSIPIYVEQPWLDLSQ